MKIILIFFLVALRLVCNEELSERSPYYQHLPDCEKREFKIIKKATDKKAIVCPMIKDETGFLSEWTAYYQAQGFDKIIYFDNNSTSPLDELDPWIKSGFVTVERNWWLNDHQGKRNNQLFKRKGRKYQDMMRIKWLGEIMCKKFAIENGFEIFVSLDLDEYLLPSKPDITVVDELYQWFNTTKRGFALLSKMQFPPNPHLLEPINLLTIEAYQTRMATPDKMNYYFSVSKKVALRLNGGEEYTNKTQELLLYCCDFHGCGNSGLHRPCRDLLNGEEMWKITGKHKPWYTLPLIYHYARSLEKYVLKQQTWDTAGQGQDYDINNYFMRLSGFTFDNSAVKWGCQVREVLRNYTGEADYVRPGDFWYRNPEFGRTVSDPGKRGRYGAGFGKVLAAKEMNPYPEGLTYQRGHKPYSPPVEGNRK